MMGKNIYSYDEVPYPSGSFPSSHPHHTGVIGFILGMNPALLDNQARVLELGCSDGSNLIPMAFYNPTTQFLGLDLSENAINKGQKTIADLGLSNIDLIQGDVMNFSLSQKPFDYIIVHGMYSWVSNEIQNRILGCIRALLKPQGIAYVSYNTYPGWHLLEIFRDLGLYHSKKFADPRDKIQQTKALIQFLDHEINKADTPYSKLVRHFVSFMQNNKENYLFHDLLEEYNSPCYFHVFAQRAREAGLKYLGESYLPGMLLENQPQSIRETIAKLTNNQIEAEQYLDFITNRQFRCTLLCHQEISIKHEVTSSILERFYYTTRFQFNELTSSAAIKFFNKGSQQAQFDQPILIKTMVVLSQQFPHTLSYVELIKHVNPADNQEMNLLHQFLIKGLTSNVLEVFTREIVGPISPPQKPKINKLVQCGIVHNFSISTPFHEVITLDSLDVFLLKQLDGTKNITTLHNDIEHAINNQVLFFELKNEALQDVIENKLTTYFNWGILR